MQKDRMNKRAQIGETMTWVVSLIVIFFLILLFLSITVLMASGRKIVEDEASLQGGKISFSEYDLLSGLLNKEVDFNGKTKIKELILRYNSSTDDEKVREKNLIKSGIESIGSELGLDAYCYIFEADYGSENFSINYLGRGVEENDYIGEGESWGYIQNIRNRVINISLFGNQEIKIKFFAGGCLS